MQYAIYKRLRLNYFSAFNIVFKWFVLTLNSFKGFELEMKKIIYVNKFVTKYCTICTRGHPWHDDTFLVLASVLIIPQEYKNPREYE
jgi:hypothetical protein